MGVLHRGGRGAAELRRLARGYLLRDGLHALSQFGGRGGPLRVDQPLHQDAADQRLVQFFRMLPYLPAKGLIRYLSTRTATAIRLPDYGRWPARAYARMSR